MNVNMNLKGKYNVKNYVYIHINMQSKHDKLVK